MKHYGDITKISGYAVEPVDVITGGSPCQDLSVAGKRAGMSKACPVCGYKAVGNSEEDICPHCGAELGYTRSGLFKSEYRFQQYARFMKQEGERQIIVPIDYERAVKEANRRRSDDG